MPIMITGMAYGLALSAKTKIALAKGSSLAGTASIREKEAFLPAERKAANKLIINTAGVSGPSLRIYSGRRMLWKYTWGRVRGRGWQYPAKGINLDLKRAMGVKWKRAFIHSHYSRHVAQEPDAPTGFSPAGSFRGVPVGIKIAASKYIEKDLEVPWVPGWTIVLDGAQAGTERISPCCRMTLDCRHYLPGKGDQIFGET